MSFDAQQASQDRVADLAGLSASKLPNTLSTIYLAPEPSVPGDGPNSSSINASSAFIAFSVVYNASDEAYTFAKHDVVHLSQCLAALIGHGFWIGLWFTILVGLWLLSYPARARKMADDSIELSNLTSFLHALSKDDEVGDSARPLTGAVTTSNERCEKALNCHAADENASRLSHSSMDAQADEDEEVDAEDEPSRGWVLGSFIAAMLSTSNPSYDRTLCLLIFSLQQINVILIAVASTVHVTKQFQASNDMFAISKTTNSLHIDLQSVVTISVLFTRILSDVAPLLKVIRLYPFSVWAKPTRRSITIYVLGLLCLARSIVAVVVGAEFTRMGRANPAVAAKIKAAASKDVTYKFFTVVTPLHLSSLFFQVFYVLGIWGFLSYTAWQVFVETRNGPLKRWHRVLRLITECTVMSFILVLPIRSATWWAFGACTFRHCPWPIVDQNQCNVSVLASLFASVWSSIERPRHPKAIEETPSTMEAPREDLPAIRPQDDARARQHDSTGEEADDDVCDIDSILATGPSSHASGSRQRRRRGHRIDDAIFPLPPPPHNAAPTQAIPFVTVVFGIRL